MIEETIRNIVLWLKLFVETVGALFIGVGAIFALIRFLKVLGNPSTRGYESTRLLLARFLSLGLEFQLAADILGTTVAPSWAQIGKLAAVAVIRQFHSGILPPYLRRSRSIEELLPWLYLKGISTGNFSEAS